MPSHPASIKQSDVTRAIKGVRAAGLEVARVVVSGDQIIVYTPAEEHNGSDEISKALGME